MTAFAPLRTLDLFLDDGVHSFAGRNATRPQEWFTFTVNTGTDVFTATGAGYATGTRVRVQASTTLPAPLVVNTDYFVRDVSGDTFKLEATLGGSAINITTSGTGTLQVSEVYVYSPRMVKDGWGSIDRSIPCPPGLFQSGDAEVLIEDTGSTVRGWLDVNTPFRRIAAIKVDDLNSDTPASPVFTGEITGAEFPPAAVQLKLRDTVAAWMNRPLPGLINRDTFENLPDGVNSIFAKRIFGTLASYSATHVTPQGVIDCPFVDTFNDWYLVGVDCGQGGECGITTAYRKRPGDDYFVALSGGAWSKTTVTVDIGDGLTYTVTLIEMTLQQEDGAQIRADVTGMDYRPAFGIDPGDAYYLTAASGSLRNPVDALINLSLEFESRMERYNIQSFVETRNRCAGLNYYCDGALDKEMSAGAALAAIQSDFGIDLYVDHNGLITVKSLSDWRECTAVAATDTVTMADGALPNGTRVQLQNSGGALPAPLAAGTDYYVINSVSSSFKLSLTSSGGAVNITTAGTGTHTIGPADSVPFAITTAITLKQSHTAALPESFKTRFRYRYARNCGASGGELLARDGETKAEIGQWGWEQTIDNADDYAEVSADGATEIDEEVIEFDFVRNDDLALTLAQERAGWSTLRSYEAEFEVDGIANMHAVDLAGAVKITHPHGISGIGWDKEIMKVRSIMLDLKSLRMRIGVKRHVPAGSIFFENSWDSGAGHPAHAANTRNPRIMVTVDGAAAATIKDVVLSATTPAAAMGYVNATIQQVESGGVRSVSFSIPDVSVDLSGYVPYTGGTYAFADGVTNPDNSGLDVAGHAFTGYVDGTAVIALDSSGALQLPGYGGGAAETHILLIDIDTGNVSASATEANRVITLDTTIFLATPATSKTVADWLEDIYGVQIPGVAAGEVYWDPDGDDIVNNNVGGVNVYGGFYSEETIFANNGVTVQPGTGIGTDDASSAAIKFVGGNIVLYGTVSTPEDTVVASFLGDVSTLSDGEIGVQVYSYWGTPALRQLLVTVIDGIAFVTLN